MEAVIERGADARGIRLLQDGFHMRSLSLYSSLGFEVTASCVVMSGVPEDHAKGVEVRPLTEGDVDECEALCEKVHGFARTGALRDALQAFAPFVAVRDGRIVAYAIDAQLLADGATAWPRPTPTCKGCCWARGRRLANPSRCSCRSSSDLFPMVPSPTGCVP